MGEVADAEVIGDESPGENEPKRKRSSHLDAARRVVGALTAKIAGLKETDVLEEEERDWNAAVTSAPGSSASSSASPTSTPATSPISERAQSPLLWPRLSLTQAIHLAAQTPSCGSVPARNRKRAGQAAPPGEVSAAIRCRCICGHAGRRRS